MDVLQKRVSRYEDSAKIWKLCETTLAEGYLSALTFANLVDVTRTELGPESIEDVLGKLSLIFRFADLGSPSLRRASSMACATSRTPSGRLRHDRTTPRSVHSGRAEKCASGGTLW